MLSLAAGALLATAFLHLLPEARIKIGPASGIGPIEDFDIDTTRAQPPDERRLVLDWLYL
jgi:hypothetical protein